MENGVRCSSQKGSRENRQDSRRHWEAFTGSALYSRRSAQRKSEQRRSLTDEPAGLVCNRSESGFWVAGAVGWRKDGLCDASGLIDACAERRATGLLVATCFVAAKA
jgi:hypothetical protein